MDFVNLQGGCGKAYRFRKWPATGRHLPIAGNVALARTRTRQVVQLGVVDTFAEARHHIAEFQPGVAVYTRLNVSRAHREAEHLDFAAAYPASKSVAA
jgi:hypothetical protein